MESKEVIKHLEERQSLNAKDGTHYKRYAKAIELISQNEELKKTINAEATQIANLSSDLGYFKGKSDGLEQDLKDNYIKKSDITVIAQGDSRRIVLNNETDFEELKKHGYIKKKKLPENEVAEKV